MPFRSAALFTCILVKMPCGGQATEYSSTMPCSASFFCSVALLAWYSLKDSA